MKAFRPTRKLVNDLLDGNPMGNIFLVMALESYAHRAIKYSAYLKKHNINTKEIISPHALARTAEEVIANMGKLFVK